MTSRRRHLVAALSGTGLLVALLGLVVLDGITVPDVPERLNVREVQLYQPPPPPPPPLTARDPSTDQGSPLSIAKLDTAVSLETLDLNVDIAAGSYGDFGLGTGSFGEGLGDALGIVGFGELDSDPIVLSAPIYPYPEELTDAGITRFLVSFHILIDQEGTPHLIRILENPHPSEQARLVEWLAGVRFSPPLKLGLPVRTEYEWPVLFRYEPGQR